MPTVPSSTYRLQLHKGFTFDDAAATAEYLRDLGISHVYSSPYLQASPGSMHGYDVVDHTRVNEELGGSSALGSGGMQSKVAAARIASSAGIATVIASGRRDGVLAGIVAGEQQGTRFAPHETPDSSYKLWLRYARQPVARLHIDAGAERALRCEPSRRLPVLGPWIGGNRAAGVRIASDCRSMDRNAARRNRQQMLNTRDSIERNKDERILTERNYCAVSIDKSPSSSRPIPSGLGAPSIGRPGAR